MILLRTGTASKGQYYKNSFKDDNANVIEKFKSVSFDYQKNGDVVSFEQQKFNSKLIPSGDIIATVNGTNLYYVHYINKVVSDDYELTEQDKKTRPVENLYSVTMTALLRLMSVRFKALTGIKMTSSMICCK